MEMQLFHQDHAVLFVVRDCYMYSWHKIASELNTYVALLFLFNTVCKNGDEVHLPGEPFMIDCNVWYKTIFTSYFIEFICTILIFSSCTSTGLSLCTLIACEGMKT